MERGAAVRVFVVRTGTGVEELLHCRGLAAGGGPEEGLREDGGAIRDVRNLGGGGDEEVEDFGVDVGEEDSVVERRLGGGVGGEDSAAEGEEEFG